MSAIPQKPDIYETGDNVFFTSDLHLFHDREFIWKARGFNSVSEMNSEIEERWNSVIGENDNAYVLGDLMLGGTSNNGLEIIKRLKGNIHIIIGNHDTDNRIMLYSQLDNVKSVSYSGMVKYNGYKFMLTHMPCLTGSLEKESVKQMTLNLSGHTHSKDKFFYDLPYVYNVAVDAHDCKPVHIEDIIKDINGKVEECKRLV